MDADWHWYRLEYQAWGSTHAHGCAKLKNDPGISDLVIKAAAGWLITQQDTTPNEDILREAEEATQAVLQYADWLVTTCNDAIPDSTWHLPQPHPSSILRCEIQDPEADYKDLVNSVQRHTRCSAAYCLRKKQVNKKPNVTLTTLNLNNTYLLLLLKSYLMAIFGQHLPLAGMILL